MIVKDLVSDVAGIWPLIIFSSLVFISLRVAHLSKGNKKAVIYKEILSLAFIIYLLFLYHMLINVDTGYNGVSLTPFTEMFRYAFGSKEFIRHIVTNIIIFIPLGFGVSYYLNTKKTLTPLIIIIVIATCLEGLQYYIYKIFDIDDLLLTVLGGFIGYLIYIAFSAIRSKLPHFMKTDGFANFVVIIIIIILILCALGIDIFSYL